MDKIISLDLRKSQEPPRTFIITQMRNVINRKILDVLEDAEVFFAELSFELIPSVDEVNNQIRDPKDQPFLYTAIACSIDVTLTGDKDFPALTFPSQN